MKKGKHGKSKEGSCQIFISICDMSVGFVSGKKQTEVKHVRKLKEKICDAYDESWKHLTEEQKSKRTDELTDSVRFCCGEAHLVSTQFIH